MATFAIWYTSEKTLSIHTIYTLRREAFYWAAILFTFALGTAAGDLLSEKLKLGYLVATLIFGTAIALVVVSHFGQGERGPDLLDRLHPDPPLRRFHRGLPLPGTQ
jgi:uncharacterized membrane-anchored protein